MDFTAMSAWAFAGLAALTAGALAALQYLRARPRRTRVVTTLFWKQSLEQDRARTLFERFRHPRTYLLLLAASLLVLLALAAPVFHSRSAAHRVIALEAGLTMGAGDGRFANALALLRSEARSLGEERVAVISADPQPRVLKRFDESLAALEGRLARVKPADSPAVRTDLLETAKSLLAGRANGEVVLITAQPVAVKEPSLRVLAAGGKIENRFLLSAVFAPDPADPTRGTLRCRIGFTGRQAAPVKVAITRESATVSDQSFTIEPGATKEVSLAGLAADGAVLSVALDGNDAIAGDDRIEFRLPDRRRIHVAPVAGFEVPPVLAAVLKSLPEVSGDPDAASHPTIRIGPAGSDAGIRIHPRETAGDWLPVRASGHAWVAGIEFEDSVCRAGQGALGAASDAIPLLLADRFPLASLDAGNKRLHVAGALLDADASVVRRTGYLVFWSGVLHQLAGWTGEPVTLSPEQGTRTTDPAADQLVMKAGFGNFDIAGDETAASPGGIGAPHPPAWQWLLGAALALMLIEAILNLRGKIV
jgi:hypothetical protein